MKSTCKFTRRGRVLGVRRHPRPLRLRADLSDETGDERSAVGVFIVDVASGVGIGSKEGRVELVGRQVGVAQSLSIVDDAVVHGFPGFTVNSGATQGDRTHLGSEKRGEGRKV